MKRALSVLLVSGCATAATKDNAAHRGEVQKTDAGVMTSMPDAAAPVAPAAPEPTGPVTAFYPVIQGACPAATGVLVGQLPILLFPKAAWGLPRDGAAKPLAQQYAASYSWFYGGMLGETDRLGVIGGVDEEHLWYTKGNSSGRGEDGSELFFRGKRLSTPEGGQGFFGIANVVQQPDGSIWAFGNHSMYLDIPGDEKVTARFGANGPHWAYDRWFAWSKDGEPLTDVNLPMGDMARAHRLENGELVAAGVDRSQKFQLRRWSPTRKVTDFTTNDVSKDEWRDIPDVRVGRMRAVMKPNGKNVFYTYDGAEKFGVSALTAKAKAPSSWLVTSSDELWIATEDGRIFIETKDGVVTEEKAPERGFLAREKSTPWFMGNSGAVYERTNGEWRKLALPDGLWSDAQHPPDRVEWVAKLGSETWASTVRTDKGFGFKNPTEVRTFYSSRPRATPLRCGSPYETSMLFALPAKADASCKDLVVVLGREFGRDGKLAIPWLKLAAALKTEPAVGASLTLGVFGDAGAYGIHAPTREIADVLVKKLARVTLHEPEVVCGAPDEKRTSTLDVAKGSFTPLPSPVAPPKADAGAR